MIIQYLVVALALTISAMAAANELRPRLLRHFWHDDDQLIPQYTGPIDITTSRRVLDAQAIRREFDRLTSELHGGSLDLSSPTGRKHWLLTGDNIIWRPFAIPSDQLLKAFYGKHSFEDAWIAFDRLLARVILQRQAGLLPEEDAHFMGIEDDGAESVMGYFRGRWRVINTNIWLPSQVIASDRSMDWVSRNLSAMQRHVIQRYLRLYRWKRLARRLETLFALATGETLSVPYAKLRDRMERAIDAPRDAYISSLLPEFALTLFLGNETGLLSSEEWQAICKSNDSLRLVEKELGLSLCPNVAASCRIDFQLDQKRLDH